jgi:uncharacterized iron-regulated membrane protein
MPRKHSPITSSPAKPSKSGGRTLKYWIGQIHLWLGLASGLVVFVVSLTGCLFSFQEEISNIYYKDRFIVTPAESTRPLSELLKEATTSLGAPVNYITTYKDPSKAWEFMSYKSNDTALTYFGTMERYTSVYLDPHTGRVTGFRDYKHDFFFVVKYLHWSLLLNDAYGQPIVGWSTAIFVLLLITGLVLWWPKRWNKAARRQSLTIRWGARVRRLNYDLHNVLGFYALLLGLVIGLTGMVFAFNWFSRAVEVTASGSTRASVFPSFAPLQLASSQNPIDAAFAAVRQEQPGARRIGLVAPASSDTTISLSAYKSHETYYDRIDYQFAQHSGHLLSKEDFADRRAGSKLINMNYDLHVGAIGGLPGKIIAFLASLICASLPITGFLVWWWKRRGKPKRPSIS